MSKYSIVASNARMSALTENNLGKELLQISGTINTISKALAIHDCSQAMLQAALSGVIKELESNSDTMKQLGKALTDIANIYERTDKHISNSMTTANSGGILDWLSKSHKSEYTKYSGSFLGGFGGYDLLGYSAEFKPWSKASFDGYLAKASLGREGKYAGGNLEATLGKVSASGELNASIFEDGKLRPGLLAEAKVGGSVLSGEASGRLGTEEYNAHAKADGDLLTAEASVSAGAGVIEKEKDGKKTTEIGVKAEAGAEAYVAKGEVSGGFTIGGLKIDATVEGDAFGAGAKAGGSVTTDGLNLDLGLGLVVGGEVDISVDWSDLFD
ncbi:MAG: hypothetical protein K6F39_04500 [Lachnospiraceae bacterium]|nr:hypothetical protein [Lachnospiraceae bacterium]